MSGPAGMQGPPAVRHLCAADDPDQRNARSPERAQKSCALLLTLTYIEGGNSPITSKSPFLTRMQYGVLCICRGVCPPTA